eukprot:Opistho-2@47036
MEGLFAGGAGKIAEKSRGLQNFISEIRACKSKEAEQKRINKELNNIRNKFKGDKQQQLSGTQRKKYVAKLLYMFLLGVDIDFGHMEAVGLIASNVYSEKMIGYLFVTVILNENSELIRLIIQSIKNDLMSRNESHVCLALNCIANIGGKEMSESLSQEVQKLLVSADSKNFVKKKAALTLLRLFRKYPEVLPAGEWTSRIINLLDDDDLGVVQSVVSLLLALVQKDPYEYRACTSKAVARLYRVANGEDNLDGYVYYHVPAPWLQVKLLRLLQAFSLSEMESATQRRLLDVLGKIVAKASAEPSKDKNNKDHTMQYFNARNAVLFEAIQVIIHIESETDLLIQSSNLLGKFLSSKETNLRYMALEAMTSLATVEFAHEPLKQHQPTVIAALRQEKDISVRRRALDLLFNLCDKENARVIVKELLSYLQKADYELREEMVLKIAVLAERYAEDYTWYVDTILKLITLSGDSVSEEVWHRVIQVVTNRGEDIQEYACRVVFEALQQPATHEKMVRVGGYILGEFGHLIANDPKSSPESQFEVLHSHYGMVGIETRAMLLSTYVKFVNLFPELKPHIVDIFRHPNQSRNADSEIQQRAVEYLALASYARDDVIQTVLEAMPNFPERESSILSKLKMKEDHLTDKPHEASRRRSSVSAHDERTRAASDTTSAPAPARGGVDDLIGIGGDQQQQVQQQGSGPAGLTAGAAPPPTAGAEKWLPRFVCSNEGVLYEDDFLQVGVRSEFKNNLGRVALYFGNKSKQYSLDNFLSNVYVNNLSDSLNIQVKPVPTVLPPGQQSQQFINIECIKEFEAHPLVAISFSVAGRPVGVSLRLPVYISKFFSPMEMNQQDFFNRWKQLGSGPLEAQKIIQARDAMDVPLMKKKVSTFGLTLLEGIDPNPDNAVAAGIVQTSSGQVGCLLRLEPNFDAKMYRLTFRTSKELSSRRLAETLAEQF